MWGEIMPENDKKKASVREIQGILTSGAIRKRMRVEVPKDLKEPKTPEPTKTQRRKEK